MGSGDTFQTDAITKGNGKDLEATNARGVYVGSQLGTGIFRLLRIK
jgi:hypothetical protein